MELEESHTLMVIGSAFEPIFVICQLKGQICQRKVPEYMSDRLPENIQHHIECQSTFFRMFVGITRTVIVLKVINP